jgi:predicted kinase
MVYYVVIRGPAGIGKSTIAKKLADILSGYYISFDEIMKKNKLDTIVDDGIPAENFVKANVLVIPQAREKLKNNKIVIFDGCFYRGEQIQHLKKSLAFKHFLFSLKAPLKECLERNKTRKKPMNNKAIKEVYHLVSVLQIGIEIDTSEKTEIEVVSKILKYLPMNNNKIISSST